MSEHAEAEPPTWGEVHPAFVDIQRDVARAEHVVAKNHLILAAADRLCLLIDAGEIAFQDAVDGFCDVARDHGLLTPGVEAEIGHRLRGDVDGRQHAAVEYHRNQPPAVTDAPPIVAGGSQSSDAAWDEFDRQLRHRPLTEHQQFLRRLLDPRVSTDRAYWAIQAEVERLRGTAQSTIDPILYAVSKRGLAALQEPAVRERAEQCDVAAWGQINQRIARLLAKGEI